MPKGGSELDPSSKAPSSGAPSRSRPAPAHLTSFPTVMDAITFFTASFFFSFLSLFSSAFSSKISPKKGGSVNDLSPPARGRCPVPNLPKNGKEAGKTLCCPLRAVCGPGLGGTGSSGWKPGGHAELRGEEPWKLWRQEQCRQVLFS